MNHRMPVLALCFAAIAIHGPGLAAGAVETASPIQAFGVAATSKVGQDQAPGADWSPKGIAIECARNETESFQVVFRGSQSVEGLQLEWGELRAKSGKVLAGAPVEVRKADWVDVNAPFDPREPSTRPNLLPDPLSPVDLRGDRFCLKPGKNLLFWGTVGVPEEAAPGEYRGELRLKAAGKVLTTVAVELRVFSFALPRLPSLQSMVSLSAGNIYSAHGCRTAEEKEKIIRRYFDEYIRARLSPFLYATGTMAFNPLPGGAIQYEFRKDKAGRLTGEMSLDFQGFDAAGRYYFDERQAFSAFNFAPYLWATKGKGANREVYLRFADSRGNAVLGRNADGSPNPMFERLVVAFFRQVARHLAEKGWLQRSVYYVTDEPPESELETIATICRLVRKADPRLRTALTYDPANRPRLAELVEDGRSLVSIWIPYCTLYREDVAARQRERGADYWLYDVKDFCLISHSGLQNRGIFWDVWRRGAHGYAYYLSTYWGREATPWNRPNFLLPGVSYRYRHGDGYFFYPPTRNPVSATPILDKVVTSMRWELMREGVEDYEYLHKLESLVAQHATQTPAAAEAGQRTLAKARQWAESLGSSTNYTIAALDLPKSPGWSWSATESWLSCRPKSDLPMPIRFKTGLPDGRYELWLRVYDAKSHHGREYSRWKVDGRAYASSGEDMQGPVSVAAGQVEVRDGICSFLLSPVAGDCGVIVYGVGLSRPAAAKNTGLYALRREIAEAIERFQIPYAVDRSGRRPVPVFTAPDHCAWPNLKLLGDGRTLAALIFNAASHGSRPGDIECWLSGDGGATWKLGSAATEHEPETIRMNHAAGLAANGDLLVLTSGWSNRYPPGSPRPLGSFRHAVLGPWVSRSSDGGRSWQVDRDAFPQTTPSGQPAVPFGDVQIADNGDLCVAVYSTQGPWKKYEERKFRSFLYRSKDDGRTWGQPVVVGPDSNETTVLHLGKGRWLASARLGTGVEGKDRLLLFASTDDGRTWKVKRTMTGFQRVTGHLARLRDGRVVFSYGDRASDFGKRGLEAMITSDGGETWTTPVRLVDWNGVDGGYPSSVQRADGQVVTAYYCSALPGDPPNSHKNYHMAAIVWDPERTFPKK